MFPATLSSFYLCFCFDFKLPPSLCFFFVSIIPKYFKIIDDFTVTHAPIQLFYMNFLKVYCTTLFDLWSCIFFTFPISFRYTLLQIKLGQIVFPKYTIHTKTVIFTTREEFKRYAKAVELEKDFFSLMEIHDYSNAYKVFIEVLTCLKKCLLVQDVVGIMSKCFKICQKYYVSRAYLSHKSILFYNPWEGD